MTDQLTARQTQIEAFLGRMRQLRHPCDRSEMGHAVIQARQELAQIQQRLRQIETYYGT